MTGVSIGSARLRVLQVIGNAIVGGMETFVARLSGQLQRDHGFDVLCLCPYESAATDALRRLGCAVHVAPLPDEPVWRGIQYACSLIADEGIDVIHAHLTNAHLLAGIAGKLTGTPVLATIHGRDVVAADIMMQRLADTHLHVVSRATLYQALGAGVRRGRINCVLNGVDAERFSPGVASGSLRAACGIDADVPLVGFVGRLSPEKGPELFVRAFALVLASCPEAHAVMLGEGALKPMLLQLAHDLDIADRLHIVGLRDEMPDCLREFALLVSTSHSEGTPLAIIEAQACGVPVVATHVGGVPEIVTMGETGVLVPPGQADAIAHVVVALLDRADERARLGRSGRQRMIDRFSITARNAEIAAMLQTLAYDKAPSTSRSLSRAPLTSVKANGSKPPRVRDATVAPPIDQA